MGLEEAASLSAPDLFLAASLSDEAVQRYLSSFGFRDPAAADYHLQSMADDLAVRHALAAVAAPLLDALGASVDPDAALVAFSRYLAARSARVGFLEYIREDERALALLARLLGASPFLAELLVRNPELLHWLLARLDHSLEDSPGDIAEIDGLLARLEDPASRLDALKRFKRRELLRIAARDLLERDTIAATTRSLSALAELSLDRVLAIVTAQALRTSGRQHAPGTFAVIGMGKLGGQELNYSSDIDVLYVYESAEAGDPDAHGFFQNLARRLTAALSEHTAESYLYRVDLRLRPSGRGGSLAYSLEQYGQYYESWGETFERFALIKTRPVAGNPDLGRRFVELARSFVYRKYLDYAAIEEMFRVKTRTDREIQRRRETERNIKLGRGGIREIELFTQVLQLLYGANRRALQQSNTLRALEALQDAGLVPETIAAELAGAYVFLRMLEHRLQLVQESQTHSLATAADELDLCARRLDFSDGRALEAALEEHRRRVHEIYSDLFTARDGTHSFETRQFFRLLSGDMQENEAKDFLARYRVGDPATAQAVLGALDQASSVSHVQSARRNLLANLLTLWMPRLARCAQPEQVLNRFERVAIGTGGASALFRTLLENESFREILTVVLDAGEFTAERLIRHPQLLDSLLAAPAGVGALRRRLLVAFSEMDGTDRADRLSRVRRLKHTEEFKAVADWLRAGRLRLLQQKLSIVAERGIDHVARWHAPSTGGRWAIMALGKLGGSELTVHSDLDLVFVYEGDRLDAEEFGRQEAFVRAVRDFLEQPTIEGIGYRIDTRLRPEGGKGALTIPLSGFETYLRDRAERWERLAWTRARYLTGSRRLGRTIDQMVSRFVYAPWDPTIPEYVRGVRARMERELAGEGEGDEKRLNFKLGKGGLADIDFLLQLIQIREGITRTEFRIPGTARLLARLPPTQFIRSAEAAHLRHAYVFLRTLELTARLESDSAVNWIAADARRVDAIGCRLKMLDPAGSRLLSRYHELTDRVRATYDAVLHRLQH